MKALIATLCACCFAAIPATASGHEFLGANNNPYVKLCGGCSTGGCGGGTTAEGGLSCINTAFPAWVFCIFGIVGAIGVVWFIIMWIMYAMRKWRNPNPT